MKGPRHRTGAVATRYQVFTVSMAQAETLQRLAVPGTGPVADTLPPLTFPIAVKEVGETDVSVVVRPVFPDLQETPAVATGRELE